MKFAATRILVIATRQLGDVLLTTSLIRSLRYAYRNAELDVLVYDNTDGVLAGNPDINRIITVAEHPNGRQYGRLLTKIFRRYDLAVSTLPGDRPLLYALLAAPRRASIVPPRGQQGWRKRYLVHACTELDTFNTHTVLQNLRLADLLEIPRHYAIVPPRAADPGSGVSAMVPFTWKNKAFAVLHLAPMWRYKQWTVAGWQSLLRYLTDAGLQIILSGGPGQAETAYISEVLAGVQSGYTNLAGKLSFDQLVPVLERAKIYIGPDTVVTHLAAALNTPTVALYGPTNPVKWGPWPYGYAKNDNPFVNKQPLQQINNVLLLQGLGDCVPCHQEGCERHKESKSLCLETLSVSRVIAATERMLRWGKERCLAG